MTKPSGLRDWAVVILCVAIAFALNSITIAILYDAIFSEQAGISENATQIITGAFGGILGVVGTYLGFHVGDKHHSESTPEPTTTTEQEPPP